MEGLQKIESRPESDGDEDEEREIKRVREEARERLRGNEKDVK